VAATGWIPTTTMRKSKSWEVDHFGGWEDVFLLLGDVFGLVRTLTWGNFNDNLYVYSRLGN